MRSALLTRGPLTDMPPLAELATAPDAPIVRLAPASLAVPGGLDMNPAAVYLAQLAPSGRRTQRQALDVIAGLIPDAAYDALTCPWHLLRYAHAQRIRTKLAEHYAPATANKLLAALRRVLRECWQLGLMTVEDYERAAGVKAVAGSRIGAGRALTLGELRALLESCAADPTPAGVRDAALIALMVSGGPRRSEVARLDVADYAPADGRLLIRSGKGNRDRAVFLAAGARTALADWLTLRGDAAGALFPALTRPGVSRLTDQAILVILEKRATAAGVARFSPHDLRRTMITRLLDAGADLAVVQRLAGHADPATTARYDRRGEDATRAAAERLAVPYVPNVARRTPPD